MTTTEMAGTVMTATKMTIKTQMSKCPNDRDRNIPDLNDRDQNDQTRTHTVPFARILIEAKNWQWKISSCKEFTFLFIYL